MTTLPAPYKSATLICPVCSGALRASKDQKTLTCDNRHSYDRAKQGYVNLLLNTQKRSKQPGDTQQMVEARSEFLALGHYKVIVDKMVDRLSTALIAQEGSKAQLSEPKKEKVLHYTDIACGEGYYTSAITEALKNKGFVYQAKGIDISTPAIKAASRCYKNVFWYVGNAFHMPLASNSQDLCTHMFARLSDTEAARILKSGGILVDVQAGPSHLTGLKQALYETPIEKSPSDDNGSMSEFFDVLETETLRFEFDLNSAEQVSNLIGMTPHMWRTPKDRLENAKSLDRLKLEADIVISLYRRNQTPYSPSN